MSQYTDFLIELFEGFGPVTARRMFGGHGIFHDGLMIGLVAQDVLYLKADSELSHKFEALGLPPFTYEKAGKSMHLSYFQAPEAIFDDPQLASAWARDAYQAALRSRPVPKAGRSKKKSPLKQPIKTIATTPRPEGKNAKRPAVRKATRK